MKPDTLSYHDIESNQQLVTQQKSACQHVHHIVQHWMNFDILILWMLLRLWTLNLFVQTCQRVKTTRRRVRISTQLLVTTASQGPAVVRRVPSFIPEHQVCYAPPASLPPRFRPSTLPLTSQKRLCIKRQPDKSSLVARIDVVLNRLNFRLAVTNVDPKPN